MHRMLTLLTLAACARSVPVAATVHAPVAQAAATPDVLTITKDSSKPMPAPGPVYLPPGVTDLTLGMPMADVEPLHTLSAPDTLMDFRLERAETFPTGPVAEVTYYFDGDQPGHPLYELIVEWRDAQERDAWVKASLGAPNEGEQWSVAGLAWPVRAWVFGNRYVVAAAIPGTEWSE